MNNIKIGSGYDAHTLVFGEKLILGGVQIPFEQGLLGHSDADVLLHAICDALLGALALGDIGSHFPPTEEKWKDISSLLLLEQVGKLIEKDKYRIGNVDSTLVLQQPKVSKYIKAMRENIAKALNISVQSVSVKATTTEGMGFEGRGEGISAQAVCLIYQV